MLMYTGAGLAVKRAFDMVAAVTGLFLLAPVLLLIAVLVKYSSPGPVLFRQVRVGRGGRRFVLLKFRTMVEGGDGPQVTAAGDPRITRVGRWLRRSKLDELPQLVNVLRGDLSLVGPRPEVPRYVACYSDEDRRAVLGVRPGISDPATLCFIDEESLLVGADNPEQLYVEQVLPRKVRMYREYLRHASVARDLLVLLKTLWVLAQPGRTSEQPDTGEESGP